MDSFYINEKLCFVLPEEPLRKYQKHEDDIKEKLIRMKPIIINGFTYWIEEGRE